MAARYALYAAPAPDDPLWIFGSSAIGYDAATGAAAPYPEGAPFDRPDWREVVAEPRRYGFHGTLKAPFALHPERSEADLLEAVMLFAERRERVVVGDLEVARLKSFVALTPAEPCPALDALAADCVTHFEPFRGPMDPADRARRLKANLTATQMERLDAYGYPYIFEDFRFHMTLTGPMEAAEAEAIRAALASRYAAVAAPFAVDALVLFHQADRSAPFTVLGRFPFEG